MVEIDQECKKIESQESLSLSGEFMALPHEIEDSQAIIPPPVHNSFISENFVKYATKGTAFETNAN